MDATFERLTECNNKLDALRTHDYRFVAWIIYSAQRQCFIAGVDTYSNDGKNLQSIIAAAADDTPIGAINQIFFAICGWDEIGEVPLGIGDVDNPADLDDF